VKAREFGTAEDAEIAESADRLFREFRVFRVFRGSLIGACGALAVAGVASAQAAVHEVLGEPVAIAPGYDAHMIIVDVPPAGEGPLTTAGQRGHRHPASTYAYVSKGAVVSRLGDGAEKRFETGQGWSETPNQPHYLVNASKTEPAQLVVVQIAKAGTKTLTEPLPALPKTPVPSVQQRTDR
jgi:quercetin dioxygenase-like cupin family protein